MTPEDTEHNAMTAQKSTPALVPVPPAGTPADSLAKPVVPPPTGSPVDVPAFTPTIAPLLTDLLYPSESDEPIEAVETYLNMAEPLTVSHIKDWLMLPPSDYVEEQPEADFWAPVTGATSITSGGNLTFTAPAPLPTKAFYSVLSETP